MEAWTLDDSKTIEMIVSGGQEKTAVELIKFMYTGEIPYTEGEDIVRLLVLAHEYLVQRCEDECIKLLLEGALDLQLATDICRSHEEAPFAKKVLNKVQAELIETFGDLESIMCRANTVTASYTAFLKLPIVIIESLLASEELKVTSENTVFIAAARWLEHNLAALNEAEVEAVWSRLIGTMRFVCMTPLFLLDVVSKVQWAWARVDEEIVEAAIRFHILSPAARAVMRSGLSEGEMKKFSHRPASKKAFVNWTYSEKLETVDTMKDCSAFSPGCCCGYLFKVDIIKTSDSLNARLVFEGAAIPTTSNNMAVELSEVCALQIQGSMVRTGIQRKVVNQVHDVVDEARIISLGPSSVPSKELPEELCKNGRLVIRFGLGLASFALS